MSETSDVKEIEQIQSPENSSLEEPETLSRDELLDHVLKTKNQIEYLANNISKIQKSCNKLKSENAYLQDYVGSLMSSGLVDKK